MVCWDEDHVGVFWYIDFQKHILMINLTPAALNLLDAVKKKDWFYLEMEFLEELWGLERILIISSNCPGDDVRLTHKNSVYLGQNEVNRLQPSSVTPVLIGSMSWSQIHWNPSDVKQKGWTPAPWLRWLGKTHNHLDGLSWEQLQWTCIQIGRILNWSVSKLEIYHLVWI